MRYDDDCPCREEPEDENCGCGSRNVVGRLNGGAVCDQCWPTELAYSNRRKAEAAARRAKEEVDRRAAVEVSLLEKARSAS